MSASREKRTRQDQTSQGPSEKQLQQQAEAKKDRSWGILYTVVGVVVAVVIVALLIWNSNFFQNRTAAVTINGQDYTAADVQFYYNSVLNYYAMMGMYNYQLSAKEQFYNEADGVTWHDFFLDQAVESLKQDVALAAEAEKAGYALSADAQASVDSTLASLETKRITSGYSSRDAYLRAYYNSSMSYSKYAAILTRSALASDYASTHQASYTYEQSDLDSYYAEHKDTLDTFVISQFLFQATVPTEKDADGNTVEMTDEEKADALEQAKQEAKATAEEFLDRLESGEDAEALQEEYADSIYYSYVSQARTGNSVNSEYSDWAFSSARKSGDTTLVEYESSSTAYNYCIARFEDRYQDNSATANVRHALIGAGSDPTEEQYAQAKTKAEELLAQWEADGATEEAFAQMVQDNSADTSSASSGGLLNVSSASGYVETFMDWSLDSSRKAGDTGIIQNTGSSTKGYHIMYFVDWAAPVWQQTVENTLRSQDVNDWLEEMLESYTAENGSGLKYVG